MTTENFMADPTSIYREYLRECGHEERWQEGRKSMLLELETAVRTFRGAVGNSLLALQKEEIISVLQTIQRSNSDGVEISALYDYLCGWRRDRARARAWAEAGFSEPVDQPGDPPPVHKPHA